MTAGRDPSRPDRDGVQALLGLVLAVIAVLMAAPARLVPWGAAVHALPSHWAAAGHWGGLGQAIASQAIPLAVCTLLAIAASLLPAPARTPRRPEFIPLAIGGLLLLEPCLHLALLALLAHHAWPGAGDLLLPRLVSGDAGHVRAPVQMLVYLLAAPVAEEFFFRGRLVPWLAQRLDRVSAVTLSALAFACAHGDASQALVALPLGLLLGTLRIRGASLLACILVHMLHNALFFIAGPTLVSEPWVGLGLALAGMAYLALALTWPGGGLRLRPYWAAVAGLALVVLISACQPWYSAAQDRWWLAAMHRVITAPGLPDDLLLERLDWQCTSDRITASRRQALASALLAEPASGFDRQVWVLGRLDPAALGRATTSDEGAEAALQSLASCPLHLASHDEAARTLAGGYPGTFARVASEDPELLRFWLPLPGAGPTCLEILVRCDAWERQQLLASCERTFPGMVSAVLLALPPASITPIERRFLFSHDAQALRDIASLSPQQQRAWSP